MTDIILDTDDDLAFTAGGDVKTGNPLLQNQKRLILDEKNDYKKNPNVCVGAHGFLDDEGPEALIREVREQLRSDGQMVKRLSLNDKGQIDLIAE